MKIIYTLKAKQDLRNIYDYIAFTLLVTDAAKNTVERIMTTVRSLESIPERNPLYKNEPWHSQGVHFVPVRNYLVFYTINSNTETVSILRIMFGGQDISHQLDETVNISNA